MTVSDKDRIRWAMESTGSRNLPALSIRTIAKRDDRSPSTVSLAIREAYSRGLVTVVPTPNRDHERVPELERAIADRFCVDDVLVVQSADSTSIGPREIGRAAADFVERGGVFRSGLHVLVGSGRTVACFSSSLLARKQRNVLKARRLKFISATGALGPGAGEEDRDFAQFLDDSDVAASQLARAFSESKASLVSQPFLPERHAQVLKRIGLDSSESWQKRFRSFSVNFAVIGVGSFKKGHRLYDYSPAYVSSSSRRSVDRLIELSQQFESTKGYTPVFDICGYLMMSKEDKREAPEIDHVVQEINSRSICPRPFVITNALSMVLASGSSKARAAKQLLQDCENANVAIACFDTDLAKELLKISE